MNENTNSEQMIAAIIRRHLHENIRASASSQFRLNREAPIGSDKDILTPAVTRYLNFISCMSKS